VKARADGEGYRLACCDCGLVHDVVWEYEAGVLGMAAKRNEQETRKRRAALESLGEAVDDVIDLLDSADMAPAVHAAVKALQRALFANLAETQRSSSEPASQMKKPFPCPSGKSFL
jgi:hypothetical protein